MLFRSQDKNNSKPFIMRRIDQDRESTNKEEGLQNDFSPIFDARGQIIDLTELNHYRRILPPDATDIISTLDGKQRRGKLNGHTIEASWVNVSIDSGESQKFVRIKCGEKIVLVGANDLAVYVNSGRDRVRSCTSGIGEAISHMISDAA